MAEGVDISDEEILERFSSGIAEIFSDADLLKAKPQEFAITFELATKLHRHFSEWRVGGEWNSRRDKLKRIAWNTEDGKLQSKRIRPDIIVHQPHTDVNILVVEVKRAASRQKYDDDIKKLSLMTRPENVHPDYHYGYRLGVHLIVDLPNAQVASNDVYRNGEVDPDLTELLSAMLG